MIRFTSGNLLSTQTEALVNAVNTFGVMGKGIALLFKEKFPLNFKIYQKACKSRALAIALADRYNVLGFDISHLELQKLMYFLQEFGQTDLALKYTKGKFGPYATNLKYLLAYLEGYFFKGQICFQDMRPTDSLTLIQDRLPSVNEFLDVELSEEEKERLERVANFIEGFESPFGLELLATIWYAMKEYRSVDERIIHAYVATWSDRKS